MPARGARGRRSPRGRAFARSGQIRSSCGRDPDRDCNRSSARAIVGLGRRGGERLAAPNRALALEFVAPVSAVLDLEPSSIAGEARLVQTLCDNALELVLADRLP